ncbi:hypothetical protein B0H19DRAFT_1076192 [Mycena capillaripes]|nr:hypothetical protein B0H19DRAFT_1076192 [Mycena capillaripes]
MFDFQGLVLDLTSTFGPVVAQLGNVPVPLNQQWELVPVNNSRVLASGVSQEAGEAIVVAMGPNGGAFGAGSTSIAFNVTCVPGASAATLVNNIFGIALTASQAESITSIAPVTFETFTGRLRPEQVWSLVALD